MVTMMWGILAGARIQTFQGKEWLVANLVMFLFLHWFAFEYCAGWGLNGCLRTVLEGKC